MKWVQEPPLRSSIDFFLIYEFCFEVFVWGGRISSHIRRRQPNSDFCSFFRLALDFYGAPRPFHDVEHGGETESITLALLLSCKERFKNTETRLGIHSAPGVGHSEFDSSCLLAIAAANGHASATWHGVASVQDQIQ